MVPYFYRLARKRTDILFLGVPITNKNIDLHQGLGVPSAPFGHIYHPDAGFVEELPICKRNIGLDLKIVSKLMLQGRVKSTHTVRTHTTIC